MEKLVKFKEGDNDRFKIVQEHIVWNFTKEQLIAKIEGLQAELSRYNDMLESIDNDEVEREIDETKELKEDEK